MSTSPADRAQRTAARIAGALFLFTFIFPTSIWTFVFSKLIAPGNALSAADNIIADEFLFRSGIVGEILMAVGGIAFALVLYILLERVHKNIALLACFLKLTEAILWAVIALGHYLALLILNERASLNVFESRQIQALVGLVINPYFHIGAVALVFHGLNSTIFLYLFFKSNYVPRKLAGFGMLSYALVLLYAFMLILAPDYAMMLMIQIVFFAPSILLELTLGFWLLIKGIHAHLQESPAPGSD